MPLSIRPQRVVSVTVVVVVIVVANRYYLVRFELFEKVKKSTRSHLHSLIASFGQMAI